MHDNLTVFHIFSFAGKSPQNPGTNMLKHLRNGRPFFVLNLHPRTLHYGTKEKADFCINRNKILRSKTLTKQSPRSRKTQASNPSENDFTFGLHRSFVFSLRSFSKARILNPIGVWPHLITILLRLRQEKNMHQKKILSLDPRLMELARFGKL